MAGTLHFDLPQVTESQSGRHAGPPGEDAYRAEASLLLASFVSARADGASDLLIEIECDIGAFVCHLAREVEAGVTDASVLEFYTGHFSEMAR
ncbi:hypothetical protein [Pseudomonas sp. NPDC089569]|uniref:hypothetical protein n=1 Tax=Pseudomonas sp. NPDC089569 TaxID=3390722 RepID=UPI003D08D837